VSVKMSSRKSAAINALAGGESFAVAAAAAGVTERTLRRWRGEPAFLDALRAADSDQLTETARQLNAAGQRAVAVLVGILDSPSTAAGLRLRAASEILRHRGAFFELTNLAERLDALEAHLGVKGFSDNGHR